MKIRLKKTVVTRQPQVIQKQAGIGIGTATLWKKLLGTVAGPMIMAAPLLGWLGGRKGYKHLESPSAADSGAIRQADRALLYDRKASEIEGRVRRRLAEEGMDLDDIIKTMRA